MRHSNEIKLILSCLSSESDEKNIKTVLSLLSKKLNWQEILRIADQNNIASLFFYNIKQACGESSLPPDVYKNLNKRYYTINFQNIRYLQELKKILILFREAGIDVIVLKGAALIEGVWQNAALRQMADIDILVRKQDIIRAEKLLSDTGYVANEGYQPKEWYREHHFHIAPYFHPGKGILIEVHHNLISSKKRIHFDMDQIWQDAEIYTTGEISTKRLSREDMFIYLCLNMNSTCVGAIKYLSDITMFLKYYKESIDWDVIEKKAKDKESINCIYYSLYTAKALLGIHIDKQIIDRFKRKSSKHFLAHYLIKKMIRNDIIFDYGNHFFPDYYHSTLYQEIFREVPLGEKINSLIKFLFPQPVFSTDNDSNRLALGSRKFVFYFQRIFYLMFKSVNSYK